MRSVFRERLSGGCAFAQRWNDKRSMVRRIAGVVAAVRNLPQRRCPTQASMPPPVERNRQRVLPACRTNGNTAPGTTETSVRWISSSMRSVCCTSSVSHALPLTIGDAQHLHLRRLQQRHHRHLVGAPGPEPSWSIRYHPRATGRARDVQLDRRRTVRDGSRTIFRNYSLNTQVSFDPPPCERSPPAIRV